MGRRSPEQRLESPESAGSPGGGAPADILTGDSGPGRRPLAGLWRALETAAAGALALMSALVIYQVGARYLFDSPPSWTEELARYLQVWLVLLAAPVCLRRGMHLAVDLLSPKLPPRLGTALRTGILLLVGFYGLALAFHSIRLLGVAALQTSPALGVSMLWPYLALPLTGALIVVAAAAAIRTGGPPPEAP